MNPINIISASAGSGKTHQLAKELQEALDSGDVRPEGIVAVTFTNKAAGELQERVRQHLVKSGRVAEARRLAAARMGTVNAVCGRLLSDFCFELGLSPDLTVLDEEAADRMLRHALSSVLVGNDESITSDLCSRMGDRSAVSGGYSSYGLDWQSDVGQIVAHARSNCIGPDQFPECAARSKATIRGFLGVPVDNGRALDRNLAQALEDFLHAAQGNGDATKKTQEAVERAQRALYRLNSGRDLEWKDWVSLRNLSAAKKSESAAHPVQIAAAQHDVHPGLRRDLEKMVDVVFQLAQRALDAYQAHKLEHGVIDFVDQETCALNLLSRPAVQDRLRTEIDLVLVDEFQDTSPIQLAIFLALARIAPRSVWVGDQKQSIFAFRGTDPALMDAVIETVLGAEEPQTLSLSWRSRPELVKVTSALFAPAFAECGIPQSRVRLEPATASEAEGLGTIVEVWKLNSKNGADDAAALADAVRQMLQDPSVRVRDRLTKQARSVAAGDVAVLCRTNRAAGEVSAALGKVGVRSLLPTAGLIETWEGTVSLAGVRFWADPNDSIAAAELARFITYPTQDSQWISALVQRGADDAFLDLEPVASIKKAREEFVSAGPVEVLDRVVELLNLPELCRRWGNSSTRLANLEAIRNHALTYANECLRQAAGCTVAGLVRYLTGLARESADKQGLCFEQDAVTVCTWHGSKGLEWPVTVLFDLAERAHAWPIRGVTVASDSGKIELSDPLAGRWIRYLPYPFGGVTKDVPFLDRLVGSEANQRAIEQDRREKLRLVYVAWTRARDRVVLSGRPGKICSGVLDLLNCASQTHISEPAGQAVNWAGQEMELVIREGSPPEPIPREVTADNAYANETPRSYPPAFQHPSVSKGAGELGKVERIGDPIPVTCSADWDHVGNAFHGFLAADRPDLSQEARRRIANRLMQSWKTDGAITADALILASDRLRTWADTRFPKAVWRREWPISMRLPEMTVVRGQVDLILEAEDSLIIVDHKSFPGSLEGLQARLSSYAGQLNTYRRVVSTATGKSVSAAYIHLPVAALVVEVSDKGSRIPPCGAGTETQ